ncbi:MAG: UDP-3-O-(3-hydroxymyristoyl)glucosamine N-acyltransferase [Planctomycetaceae bacterium]|nr:UDP-3-O-(3-hydroxymyristoyl)glucosamine N-acyltransferase [Planctomycetaceae bacterium]
MAELTLQEVAAITGGTLDGDSATAISGVESLERARKQHAAFFVDKGSKNRRRFLACKAGCVLVTAGTAKPEKVGALVFVNDPDMAFIALCERFARTPAPQPTGVHPTAVVAKSAKISASASIGPYVVLGENVVIGDGTVIHAHSVLMEGVEVGKNCLIYPHCTIREFVKLGDNIKLQPGAVVGSDGFGYRFREGQVRAIPQVGTVELGDNVEIGANSCVDRARFGKTILRKDVKLDNLVQVAHNVEIGMGTTIAALSGIGGSSVIGDFCTLTGMTGIPDDLNVGAGSRLLASCGPYSDVPPGSEMYGQPAYPAREYLRIHASIPKLVNMLQEFRTFQRQMMKDARQKPARKGKE